MIKPGPIQFQYIILPQADLPNNNIVATFTEWGCMWMWDITTSTDFDNKRGCEFQHTFNEKGAAEVEVYYETWR